MKKIISFVVAFVMLLSMAGCLAGCNSGGTVSDERTIKVLYSGYYECGSKENGGGCCWYFAYYDHLPLLPEALYQGRIFGSS